MILPISGNESTKQTSKENITRDIEIKNKLTVTRGEWGGVNGKKGEGSSGNMYKGHMDKAKGGGDRGEEAYMGRAGEWCRNMETIVLEQQ